MLQFFSVFYTQTRGRAQDDEAIEKMLNDLSLIKKFE
jgi:DNA-directed RNA polymerase II subunit RPB4